MNLFTLPLLHGYIVIYVGLHQFLFLDLAVITFFGSGLCIMHLVAFHLVEHTMHFLVSDIW